MSDNSARLFFSIGIQYFTKLIEGQRCRNWQNIIIRYSRDDGFITVLSNHLRTYVQNSLLLSQHGEDAASSTTCDDHEIFSRILVLWRKFDNVLRDLSASGKENAVITEVMHRPFVNVVRSLPTSVNIELRAAEHSNSLLSANGEGNRILRVTKLEELQYVISFAKLLPESHVFIKACHAMLAKRLLDGTSENYAMECFMVQELLTYFSSEVLSLSHLLDDVALWQQHKIEIAEWFRNHSNMNPTRESIVSGPKVVRSFHWPSLSDVDIKRPKQLQEMEHSIKEFFHTKHPEKEISVSSCVGRVIVKTHLWDNEFSDAVRLSLTPGQMCILSLFEKLDRISIQGIMDELFMQNNGASPSRYPAEYEKTVIALLKSMTEQIPILKKEPASSEFETGHMIVLNKEFKPCQALIKLPSPELFAHGEKEIKKCDVPEPLREEYVEAAVMKILKDRREMSRDELVNMVTERLWMFSVGRDMIETCIRKLRDREFVEFDDQVIKYVP